MFNGGANDWITPRRSLQISLVIVGWAALGFYVCWLGQLNFHTHGEDVGPFDLVIKNGKILDGLGHSRFTADIGIRDGRIIAIGSLRKAKAKNVIEAEGQLVAPGFIDVHTHIEKNLPEGSKPFQAPNFIRQGVTTIITGNCGSSVLSVADLALVLEKKGSQVNIATFIGHNTIRRKIMNRESREPTRAEMQEMKKIVAAAMKDGALGISTGLAYVPGAYAKKEEIVELARVCAEQYGLYVSHVRDEGLKGMDAIKEAIEIGKEARVAVHISHFKASGRSQWGTARERLGLLDDAIQDGVLITIDQYPYTASSTGLEILLPPWALAGDPVQVRQRLHEPLMRARIRAEMLTQLHAGGWDDYSFARIAYCASNVALNGLTIPQAVALQVGTAPFQQLQRSLSSRSGGKQTHPQLTPVTDFASPRNGHAYGQHSIDHVSADFIRDVGQQAEAIMDLIGKGGAQMIYFDMDDEDVIEIMRHPDTVFGSDSAVRGENMQSLPHPRGMGTFPRVIARYVREERVLSIEEAVRRMTSLPASIFGIANRGQIRNGFFADLVIFDEQRILDMATYESPLRRPEGVSCVVVNGNIVLQDDHITTANPGRMIRHQQLPTEN